jgi:hypothetical protein
MGTPGQPAPLSLAGTPVRPSASASPPSIEPMVLLMDEARLPTDAPDPDALDEEVVLRRAEDVEDSWVLAEPFCVDPGTGPAEFEQANEMADAISNGTTGGRTDRDEARSE